MICNSLIRDYFVVSWFFLFDLNRFLTSKNLLFLYLFFYFNYLLFYLGISPVVLNYEEDIGFCTVRVATDPRARNRIFIFRPSTNIITQLELISLWEKKTGQQLQRVLYLRKNLLHLLSVCYVFFYFVCLFDYSSPRAREHKSVNFA